MLRNFLAMDATEIAEKTRDVDVSEAALYALLGFLIVFVGILFLIFIVWIVGKIMGKTKTKEVVKSESAPLAVAIPTEKVSHDINAVDDETVAVIMAALMAYYQKNNPKCEFTVKRIKRV